MNLIPKIRVSLWRNCPDLVTNALFLFGKWSSFLLFPTTPQEKREGREREPIGEEEKTTDCEQASLQRWLPLCSALSQLTRRSFL